MHEPGLTPETAPILIPIYTALPSWTTPVAVRRSIPFFRYAQHERPGDVHQNVIQELQQLIHSVRNQSLPTTTRIFRCLKYTRQTPDNLKVAYLLSYLGALFVGMNNPQDAELVHRRALCIGTTRLGGTNPELSFSLDWLGLSFFMQGNYTEALLTCYATKEIVIETMGAQHPNLCGCLMNMALVCDAKGWFLYASHLREEAARVLMEYMAQ